MGVVVLDADGYQLRVARSKLEGILGAQVIGVQIIGDHLGFCIKNLLKMVDALLKRFQGLQIFQISYMMTNKSQILPGQAKGIFQLRSAGQNGFLETKVQSDGLGNIAPRSPEDHLPPIHHPDYRIVAADVNVPVMDQKIVGNVL